MKIKDKAIELQNKRNEEIQKWIDEHDCNLGPEMGCSCVELRAEMNGERLEWGSTDPF